METDNAEEENKETKEEVKPVKTEKDLVRFWKCIYDDDWEVINDNPQTKIGCFFFVIFSPNHSTGLF